MTKVSAVVPCLNNEKTIGECLTRLLQNGPDEVILVDGGSSDRTRQIASEFRPVTIIKNVKDIARARNIGWQQSNGDMILFLDADAYMVPGTLSSLLEILKSTQSAGVACRIAGANLCRLVPKLRDIDFRIQYSESFRESNLTDCVSDPVICGLFHRKVLEDVDGFNSDFPFVEDVDLLERLHGMGYRILTCYTPAILHNHRETFSDIFWQLYRHGFARGIMDVRSSSDNFYLRRNLPKLIRRVTTTLKMTSSSLLLLYPFYRMIVETAYMLGYVKGRKWASETLEQAVALK